MTAATSTAREAALRVAVVGKGGAGKTIITATIARTLARRGRRVLVLDHDPAPGVSTSLGLRDADAPLLNAAMVRGDDRRLRFADGLDPIAAAQRYAVAGPDGILLLQVGKYARGADVQPSVNAFFTIVAEIERAPEFRDWSILGDLPAGGRQTASGWTPYATRYLLVAEATSGSLLTARRVKRIVAAIRPGAEIALVVSKATGPADVEHVCAQLDMPAYGVIPLDEDVRRAERAGVPVFEHAPDAPAVAAIAAIAERLEAEPPPADVGEHLQANWPR